MILYTKDFKKVEFDNTYYSNEGNCGYIFKYGNTVLKIYKELCDFRLKMKRSNFKLLKSLNAPCIVNLHDYYFKYKISPSFASRVYAYTMDYIPNNDIDILTCDRKFMEYMLTNIEKTIELMCQYDLVAYDVRRPNTILNNNGINLIDVDMFSKRSISCIHNSYRMNKLIFISLINDYIFHNSFEHDLENDYDVIEMIRENPEYSFKENVMKYITEDSLLDSIISSKQKKKIK